MALAVDSQDKPDKIEGRFPRGEAFTAIFQTDGDPQDATVYTHGIPQILKLMNTHLTNVGEHRAIMLAKNEPNAERAIEALYLATLSRRPRDEEKRRLLDYVSKSDHRGNAYSGVLWLLLNSSEFVFIP